jgi:hypothetical protein
MNGVSFSLSLEPQHVSVIKDTILSIGPMSMNMLVPSSCSRKPPLGPSVFRPQRAINHAINPASEIIPSLIWPVSCAQQSSSEIALKVVNIPR